MLGFEAPALGVGESGVRQGEGGELEEGLLHAREALLEAGGERSDRRRALGLRSDDGKGIADEGGVLALGVGGAPGGDESECLALLEMVA